MSRYAGGLGHDTKLLGGEQMTITKKKSALAENLRQILSEEGSTGALRIKQQIQRDYRNRRKAKDVRNETR